MGLVAAQAILVGHSLAVGLMALQALLEGCVFRMAFRTGEHRVLAWITLHLIALLLMAGEADRVGCGTAICDVYLQGIVGVVAVYAFFDFVVGFVSRVVAH